MRRAFNFIGDFCIGQDLCTSPSTEKTTILESHSSSRTCCSFWTFSNNYHKLFIILFYVSIIVYLSLFSFCLGSSPLWRLLNYWLIIAHKHNVNSKLTIWSWFDSLATSNPSETHKHHHVISIWTHYYKMRVSWPTAYDNHSLTGPKLWKIRNKISKLFSKYFRFSTVFINTLTLSPKSRFAVNRSTCTHRCTYTQTHTYTHTHIHTHAHTHTYTHTYTDNTTQHAMNRIIVIAVQ